VTKKIVTLIEQVTWKVIKYKSRKFIKTEWYNKYNFSTAQPDAFLRIYGSFLLKKHLC